MPGARTSKDAGKNGSPQNVVCWKCSAEEPVCFGDHGGLSHLFRSLHVTLLQAQVRALNLMAHSSLRRPAPACRVVHEHRQQHPIPWAPRLIPTLGAKVCYVNGTTSGRLELQWIATKKRLPFLAGSASRPQHPATHRGSARFYNTVTSTKAV